MTELNKKVIRKGKKAIIVNTLVFTGKTEPTPKVKPIEILENLDLLEAILIHNIDKLRHDIISLRSQYEYEKSLTNRLKKSFNND